MKDLTPNIYLLVIVERRPSVELSAAAVSPSLPAPSAAGNLYFTKQSHPEPRHGNTRSHSTLITLQFLMSKEEE